MSETTCKESILKHIPGLHGNYSLSDHSMSLYAEYRGRGVTTLIDQK